MARQYFRRIEYQGWLIDLNTAVRPRPSRAVLAPLYGGLESCSFDRVGAAFQLAQSWNGTSILSINGATASRTFLTC